MDVLRAHFRPEFLNRIDEVVFFHALGRDHMAHIIDIKVNGLLKRLESAKSTCNSPIQPWPSSFKKATIRCTAPDRSSGRSSDVSWIRWLCVCSRASSARAIQSWLMPARVL